MKRFYYLLLMIFCIGVSQLVNAQVVGWQFTSPSVNGNEASAPPSLVTNGLTVTHLTRGAGWAASGSTLARTFVSSRVGTATNADDMIEQEMYFGFNITVNENFKASLSYLTYRVRLSSSAGAKLWFWQYSLDGTKFDELNDPVVLDPAATYGGEGTDQPTVNLSGVSRLQNLPAGTKIYFRLYAGNSGSGSTAIGRSAVSTTTDYALSVGGSVENVSTPPLLAWQFTNPVSTGNEAAINASLNHADLNTATLVRGAGLNTNTSYPRSFSAGASVTSTSSLADTAIAVANNMYFGFNINAKADRAVSLSKLNYKVRRSGGGAQIYYWKYSIDNLTWNKLAEPYQLTEQNDLGVNAPVLNLSSFPQLQNVGAGKTIYLRLYVNGSNNTTGSTNIGQSDLNSTNSYVLAVEGTTSKVLPVKLSSFSGKLNGNSIKLSWLTASESNNSHFEILRLSENRLTVLGRVSGNGSITGNKQYTFTDFNPLTAVNYYQLRQVDFDGASTLSDVISVKADLNNNGFVASFSENNLNIVLHVDKAEQIQVLLTDISGKIITSSTQSLQQGANSLVIPSVVNQGVYIVSIVDGQRGRLSKKIIK